ncbi:MAG: hypothetical protein ACI9HK_001321 [Pirellulaceae bacterium]|jgi:hypothetical protein
MEVRALQSRKWRLCLLLSAVAILAGCQRGPELASVTGKVLLDGRPLKFGGVMLQPAAGQPSLGRIQPDGTFAMSTNEINDGATVGPNKIRITCYQGQDPAYGGGDAIEEKGLGKLLIDRRYANYSSSGLSTVVVSGTNEPLILNLTSEPN